MKCFAKLVTVCLSLFICSSAFAQDYETENSIINLTPRIWYSYVNLSSEDYSSTEMFALPLYGATLAVTPRSTPNWHYLLTGLYGEGDGETVSAYGNGKRDVERLDIELLARYNFPGRNFSLFVGPRYVKFDQTLNVPSFTTDLQSKIYIFELGLGTHADLTEDGRHRLFGNFTLGLGRLEWDYSDSDGLTSSDSYFAPAIDFNTGYQYAITASTNVSLRYRLFSIVTKPEVASGYEQKKLETIHGPELTFTVAF